MRLLLHQRWDSRVAPALSTFMHLALNSVAAAAAQTGMQHLWYCWGQIERGGGGGGGGGMSHECSDMWACPDSILPPQASTVRVNAVHVQPLSGACSEMICAALSAAGLLVDHVH